MLYVTNFALSFPTMSVFVGIDEVSSINRIILLILPIIKTFFCM